MPTGPIISPIFSKSVWEQHRLAIQNKRRMVLFTDGIIETESESGEYGLERLLHEIMHNPTRGNLLSQQILQSVRQFAAGRPIHDDLTVLIADL